MQKLLILIVSCMLGAIVHAQGTTTEKPPEKTEEQPKSGGWFVEPGLSLETGRTSAHYQIANSAGSSDGMGAIVRLGMHVNHYIFAAADTRFAISQFREAVINYTAKATSANLGVVGGVQMPNIGMRAWLGYVLAGVLNPDAGSNGVNLRYSNATGYRVGAAFRIANVSANLEYQQLRYGQTSVESAGPYSSDTFGDTKLSNSSWLASISFPIEI